MNVPLVWIKTRNGAGISDPTTYGATSLPRAIEELDASPAIKNGKLQALLDYWLTKVDGLKPPGRRDIDPLDIPRLLPNIWIQEHLPGTTEFRCRLAGEDVKALYATNIVGCLFREVIGDEAWELVSEQYMKVLNAPGVCHSIGPVYMHTIQRPGIGERLFVPLQNEQGVSAYILGATIYSPVSEQAEQQRDVVPSKTFTPLTALLDRAS